MLFQTGSVTLHSGTLSNYKIDCDALTDEDIETIALMIRDIVLPFGEVVGVPRGGLRLAEELERYITAGPRLVVDDVLTTGNSMNELYKEGDIGAVIFARGAVPSWITPLCIINIK